MSSRIATSAALAALLLPAFPLARADDLRCNAPPYGATSSEYQAFMGNFGKLLTNPQNTFAAVCRAKFDGDPAALQSLANVGINNQVVSNRSVVELMIDFMEALRKLAKSLPEEALDPQILTVRDLLIDGKQLADRHAYVAVVEATYGKNGAIGMLYQSHIAYLESMNGDAPADSGVPVLTDNAPHDLRARMFDCVSAYPESSCPLSVEGTMEMCNETSVFGGERDIPCLNVTDGEVNVYSPPSLSTPNNNTQKSEPATQTQIHPETTTLATSSHAMTDSRSADQKITDCIRSPEMANEDNVYLRCKQKLGLP